MGTKALTEEQRAAKQARQKKWAKDKRDKAKAAADGEKAVAKKADKIAKKPDKHSQRAADAVHKALKSGAIDKGKVADRIIKRYDGLKKAEANAANVGKRAAEEIKGAKESFDAVIGETVGIEDNGAKAKKLDKVVSKYSDYQGAISEGAAKRAAAKKAKKEAHEKFDRVIEEAKQPQLPGLEESDGEDDEDESED